MGLFSSKNNFNRSCFRGKLCPSRTQLRHHKKFEIFINGSGNGDALFLEDNRVLCDMHDSGVQLEASRCLIEDR